MKRFIYVLTAVVAVVIALTSCEKSENYPSNLSGTWSYENASSGYSGELEIENIAGGQYATFELDSPTETVASIEGSFIYDASTGVGTINNSVAGGSTVLVQAKRGSDSKLEVSVSKIISGGSEQSFSGVFVKE